MVSLVAMHLRVHRVHRQLAGCRYAPNVPCTCRYDTNKHIFPASRWEVYDPEKNYGSYNIADSSKDFN